MKIFIGYDEVETVAFHTLVQSIINHASEPVEIIPLKLTMLPMYTRERDPKQSNEFSFTRFLVPYLCGYKGKALFMDCDMIFRTDPKELFDLMDDKAVMVVKHDYTPKTKTKFLGAVQYQYPRKNWSSVMLFNCGHDDCARLTPEFVNTESAMTLHRFGWTNNIGELPVEWNHLVGEYHENPKAKNAHFTVGGPWFDEYKGVEFSDEWFSVNNDMLACEQLKRDVG